MNNKLNKCIYVLFEKFLNLKKDEKILICGDFRSNKQILKTTKMIANKIGAKAVINNSTRNLAEEPSDELVSKMLNNDVIIDFSEQYLQYTKAWKNALESGVRGYSLGNLSVEGLTRCMEERNISKIMNIGNKLAELTKNANLMKITTESGSNIAMKLLPFKNKIIKFAFPTFFNKIPTLRSWVGSPTGFCLNPSQNTFLIGQVSFNGIQKSINGIAVFDGSISPPSSLGLLKSSVTCKIKHGKIVDISGNNEAEIFNNWLNNFQKKSMFEVVHFSYGFNPGAKLSGCIYEDERYFGALTIGIGDYPSHSDGVIKKPSIFIDDDIIEKNGKYTFPY